MVQCMSPVPTPDRAEGSPTPPPAAGLLARALAGARGAMDQVLGFDTSVANVDRVATSRQILRLLVAVGYTMGAITLAGAALFAADHVHPVRAAWIFAAIFGGLAIVLIAGGHRLPERLVRFIAFELTALLLCALLASATPTYVVLLHFTWPALTCSYFGTSRDVISTVTVITVGLAVALAFSTVPLPALAYVATMGVIIFAVSVLRSIVTRAVVLFEQLQTLATTDALTGLLNRHAVTERLAESVARAQREGTQLAIAILDIDHFKQVNDRFGHDAGDQALRRFAEVLQATCAGTDVASRLGGEEFLVLLLRSDEAGAQAFAERFISALDDETAGDRVPLSVSVGVAALNELHRDGDALLIAADRALYAAKEGGRHQVRLASETAIRPLADHSG